MNVPWVSHFTLSVRLRPKLVVGLVTGLLIAYVAWQVTILWRDQPLSADRVSARRLRVNTSQLQTLQQQLRAYHQPAAAVPSQTTFQAGSAPTR